MIVRCDVSDGVFTAPRVRWSRVRWAPMVLRECRCMRYRAGSVDGMVMGPFA